MDAGQGSRAAERMRRKGALAAIISGTIVLTLAVFLALRWDEVVFAWHGFGLQWMPVGTIPSGSQHHQMNAGGQVVWSKNLIRHPGSRT